MKNLHQIRYYSKRYEPHEFKNKGVRGWWIRVLNRMRFWIERRVVYHVLVLSTRSLGDLADLDRVRQEFEKDIESSRQHLNFKQQRPRMTVPPTGSVQGHLKRIRQRGAFETPREQTERILERYAANPRVQRYAWARGHHVMMEAEAAQELNDGQVSIPQQRVESQPRTGESRQAADFRRTGRVRPIHPEYSADILPFTEEADVRDGDDSESPEEYERRASPRYRTAAAVATDHQRSVFARERSPVANSGTGNADRGADDERAGRSGSSAAPAAEQAAADHRSPEDDREARDDAESAGTGKRGGVPDGESSGASA